MRPLDIGDRERSKRLAFLNLMDRHAHISEISEDLSLTHTTKTSSVIEREMDAEIDAKRER